MSFAVMYYVDLETVNRYAKRGIKRQPGFVAGRDRYATHEEAEQLAAHINSFGPVAPAYVIRSNAAVTACGFRPPRLWPSQSGRS